MAKTIIDSMYSALERFGFKGGSMLEPSMGVGNFFAMKPESLQNSRLTGVELDSVTGRIAQKLYPNADIRVQGFERMNIPDNSFDVAVGNIP